MISCMLHQKYRQVKLNWTTKFKAALTNRGEKAAHGMAEISAKQIF